MIDAMLGQDAVNTARAFNERLSLTGVVLTKLDGDSRGGAALSVRMVTGKPIKFVGMGEKLDGFELFNPEQMAGRILGMATSSRSSKMFRNRSTKKPLKSSPRRSSPATSSTWKTSRARFRR